MAPHRPKLFLLFHQAHHALFQRLNAEARERLGVSLPQAVTLLRLAKHPQSRPGDLARALTIDPAAVTRVAARLERAELVSRTEDPNDRRGRVLSLTAAGDEKAAAALAEVADANRRLTAPFTADEIAVVARFFEHAIAMASDPQRPRRP